MKDQINTIREAFEATQLKRECRRLPNGDYENSFVNSAWRYFQAGVGAANDMTKGQKPVTWLCIVNTADAGPTKFFTAPSDPRGFPVFAAPVAQQYEAGDMASAHNDGFRAGVASVAQQPQARPDFTDEWTGYLKDGETPFERFLRERKDMQSVLKLYQRALEENERLKAQQPQAEAVPTIYVSRGQLENLKPDPEDEAGTYLPVRKTPKGKFMHPLFAAPQQTEAVPADFRDRLVAISQAIADQDDRAAQAMIREILAAPQQAEAVPSDVVRDAMVKAACDAVAAALGDAYDCTRVWEAWKYGTMGQDDFYLVSEDSDRVREIAVAAIDAAMAQGEKP